jgi:excisionase family DNA binding protein
MVTARPFDVSKVMTVKELASYLQVHTSTIYRLLNKGLLPGYKVGSDWRFNFEDVEKWRFGKVT